MTQYDLETLRICVLIVMFSAVVLVTVALMKK